MRHFHAVVISPKKRDIRSVDRFTIEVERGRRPSDCKSVKCLTVAISDACKEGSYETNIKNILDEALMPIEVLLRAKAKRIGRRATLQFYLDNYPKQAMGGKVYRR